MSDGFLYKFSTTIHHHHPPLPLPFAQLPTHQESQDRRDAVAFLFGTLDADGDERLNLPEMERFASLCGFAGEWATEYEVRGIAP